MLYLSPIHNSMLDLLDRMPSFDPCAVEQDFTVTENDDSITVEFELPGFERDKITIMRTGQDLSITAERDRKGSKISVSRAFVFPEKFDLESAEAEYKSGVVFITAKRKEGFKQRRIDLK